MECIKVEEMSNHAQTMPKLETHKSSKALKRNKGGNQSSQSQSFHPEYHQLKRLGLQIDKSRLLTGSWSIQENKIYLDFMVANKEHFKNERMRRKEKVFYRLSKILRKRTPDQCRSHHQKLQIKYNENLDLIIAEIKRKIEKPTNPEDQGESHQLKEKPRFLNIAKTNDSQEKEQAENEDQPDPKKFYAINSHNPAWLTITINFSNIIQWP